MNGNKPVRFQISETLRALLKTLLLLASIGLPYYFHFVLEMEVALVDLLYTPIVLIVLWWPTAGILVALSLSLLLLLPHLFFEPSTLLFHDLQRSFALYAIALLMNILSRQAKEAEQEIRQRNQELSALNAIASTASQSLDLDEILEVTFDKVLKTMGVGAGGIYLLDEKGKKLITKVYRGASPELVEEAMKLDDGLAGQVLQSGESMVIEDVFEKPELVPMTAKGERFQTYVSVPLKSKEKVLGVMNVITRRPHRLAPQDVKLLTSIGDHIGVAVENARLFEETRRRLRESEALFQVGKGITSVLDLEKLLQLIINSAVEAIGPAERGVIHLLDEASGELHPKALAGRALGALRETKMRIGEGIAGLVIREREAINVQDINADSRFMRLRGSQGFKSLLVAPLLIGEKRIGTISVESEKVDAFGPDDERLLTTLASQAAIAIENARLFEDVQRRVQELADLSEASRAITSSLDLEDVLTKIVSLAGRVVDSVATSVVLVEEDGNFSLSIEDPPDIPPASHEAQPQGITRQIVATGKPVIINEMFQDGSTKPPIAGDEGPIKINPALLKAGIRSGAGIPIISKGRKWGALFVHSLRPYAFKGRLPLLTAFANQAAIAIENARLFGKLEQWGNELETRVEERTRELTEAQERLIRAERLVTIGQFGASVGHELRNPLGVIKNSIYYLKMKLSDADEKVEKHLQIVEEEIARSNKIIGDLMSFARGKKPTLKRIQINTIVQDALSRATVLDTVTVIAELGEDLPPLRADPDQIQQIFINMISNATQAMSDGGRLEIATRAEDGFIVTEFKDYGHGIPEENLDKIFEPLFTTKAKGLGLGLAVCKQIVEAHKGTIEVESPSTGLGPSPSTEPGPCTDPVEVTAEAGKGTTFRIRLPFEANQ